MTTEQRYIRQLLESNIQQDLIVEISLTDLFKKNSSGVDVNSVEETEKILGLMYGISYMLIKECTLYKGDFYAYLKKSVQKNFKELQELEKKWAKIDGKSVDDLKRMGAKALGELGLNLLIPGYSLIKKGVKSAANRKLQSREDASNWDEKLPIIYEMFEEDEDEDEFENLFGRNNKDAQNQKKAEQERLLKKQEIINPRFFKKPYSAVMFYNEEPATLAEAMELVEDQIQMIYKKYVSAEKRLPQLYSHFNGFMYFNESILDNDSLDTTKNPEVKQKNSSSRAAALKKFVDKTAKPTFNNGKIDTLSVIISNYLKDNLVKEHTKLIVQFEKLASGMGGGENTGEQEEN